MYFGIFIKDFLTSMLCFAIRSRQITVKWYLKWGGEERNMSNIINTGREMFDQLWTGKKKKKKSTFMSGSDTAWMAARSPDTLSPMRFGIQNEPVFIMQLMWLEWNSCPLHFLAQRSKWASVCLHYFQESKHEYILQATIKEVRGQPWINTFSKATGVPTRRYSWCQSSSSKPSLYCRLKGRRTLGQ